MTAPDTDTLIALAREGRIAVVSQWRWRHKNELSSWRGWHDGQPVVPFSEWNRDIYEWEERLSYVLPEGAPTLTPALRALAEERDRLREGVARALRIVSEMERQTKVNDSYASDLPKSERNTSELWLICNSHIKDRASEIRRALTGDAP